MRKRAKMILLLLPFLTTYMFQATQYARAPVKYNYYVVYAKAADIALVPGTDRSPDNTPLLSNSTIQDGLYNLTLGKWGPGYRINYTDAFHVKNNEQFSVRLIGVNFSDVLIGSQYISIYVHNDSDGDGNPDGNWTAAWIGSEMEDPSTGDQLSMSYFIYFAPNAELPVMIRIDLLDANPDWQLTPVSPAKWYGGTIYLWFVNG